MIKKLLILVILILLIVNGALIIVYSGVDFDLFVGKMLKLSQGPSDCKENQYYDASVGKCKKIINECYTDEDCPEFETCEREAIRTHMACRLGEECPSWYHNVCELTEETIKYCEKDSDCVVVIKPNTCCWCPQIYNRKIAEADSELVIYEKGKDYSALRTVYCSDVSCAPCAFSPDVSIECKNNRCVIIPE